MTIKYESGMKLQLWVWDTGAMEGFAVYLNGEFLDPQQVEQMRYDIEPPTTPLSVSVHFAGADGGATKLVDKANGIRVLEHQDTGLRHNYIISV